MKILPMMRMNRDMSTGSFRSREARQSRRLSEGSMVLRECILNFSFFRKRLRYQRSRMGRRPPDFLVMKKTNTLVEALTD